MTYKQTLRNTLDKGKEIDFTGINLLLAIIQVLFLCSKIFQFGICKDWNWFMVFIPMWGLPALVVGFFIAFLAGLGLIWLIVYTTDKVSSWWKKRKQRSKATKSQILSEKGFGNTYCQVKRY